MTKNFFDKQAGKMASGSSADAFGIESSATDAHTLSSQFEEHHKQSEPQGRYLFWLLIFVAMVCIFIGVQQDVSADVESVGLVATPDHIELGVVASGQNIIKTDVTITNKSGFSIYVTRILSGCSCTVGELEDDTIFAGESVPLKVRINLQLSRGHEINLAVMILMKSSGGDQLNPLVIPITGEFKKSDPDDRQTKTQAQGIG